MDGRLILRIGVFDEFTSMREGELREIIC